jgi:uncharacterized membrane protein
MKNLDQHSSKEFQVERLVLFSDAVFAIAITLLIIDLKVPDIHGRPVSEQSFIDAFALLMPKLIGFALSFWIIGLYWFIHHRMFSYVINSNGKLIWLNLLFLFSIVLMPFSTAVYSEYSAPEYIRLISPYALYVGNICLTGFVNFLMWGFIGNPKNLLTKDLPKGDFLQKAKIRSLLLPSVFIISLLFTWVVDPILGRFILFLTPIIMGFVRNKKQNSDRKEKLPPKNVP